ncbi:MAG: ribosome biogenesis GTP-binding protein YihA/YsxC [Melioribacteraceae bacterium]|nr:ribosome biogenesis GTP-binding protein YihA/YsxC [Melioribacteraceae bacterium]MCF8354693.1 ribosome biogenesis GTP-binding protein YihA/YsxC [Melioribacteraceae bacterium]MCF8393595.1 ribosome biogenesis GTP-binding protein YihA/YsxC [Melioribacteraceae bacterium]MCF8419405.1 ribosome biogenesis GTP-binding protein YihA/YsxC [Melioribacteraceae bacterium]
MKNVQFIKSVYNLNDLPKRLLPEIVLCGRSNVGKSSFINSFFNKKNLAKISSTPGKTRSLNYYLVEDKFYIVDLPGFGYAKGPVKEKLAWQKLIEQYLNSGRMIVNAFHFIDSRHKPMELDLMLNDFFRTTDIPYLVLLNKVDKLKQAEISKSIKTVCDYFPELIPGENLFRYSSVKGIGKKEVAKRLSQLIT